MRIWYCSVNPVCAAPIQCEVEGLYSLRAENTGKAKCFLLSVPPQKVTIDLLLGAVSKLIYNATTELQDVQRSHGAIAGKFTI